VKNRRTGRSSGRCSLGLIPPMTLRIPPLRRAETRLRGEGPGTRGRGERRSRRQVPPGTAVLVVPGVVPFRVNPERVPSRCSPRRALRWANGQAKRGVDQWVSA
jgi:hypothetical protein